MRTILIIVLLLLLLAALPTWPYSSGWGYYPTGGLGLILLIVLILWLLGASNDPNSRLLRTHLGRIISFWQHRADHAPLSETALWTRLKCICAANNLSSRERIGLIPERSSRRLC